MKRRLLAELNFAMAALDHVLNDERSSLDPKRCAEICGEIAAEIAAECRVRADGKGSKGANK